MLFTAPESYLCLVAVPVKVVIGWPYQAIDQERVSCPFIAPLGIPSSYISTSIEAVVPAIPACYGAGKKVDGPVLSLKAVTLDVGLSEPLGELSPRPGSLARNWLFLSTSIRCSGMPFHFIKGVYGGVTLSISKCRVLECRVLQATKKISLSISTGVLEFFTALFRIESLFIPPFFTHAILLGRTAELMRLICFDPGWARLFMVPDSYAGLSSAVWLSLDSWDCCVRFSCPVKASARLGLLESLKRSSALWPLSFFKEKFWKDRQAWNYSFWAECLMITMHGVETDRCDDNQQKRDFLFQERHEFASW